MKHFQALLQLAFPASMDTYFSEEKQEEAALRVAARLSRGNTNTQDIRVTTDRLFKKQMEEYAKKVEAKKFVFQR